MAVTQFHIQLLERRVKAVTVWPRYLGSMVTTWKMDFHCLWVLFLVTPHWWCFLSSSMARTIERHFQRNHLKLAFSVGTRVQAAAIAYIPHSRNMSNEHVCCANSSPSAYQLFFLVAPSTVLTFLISELKKIGDYWLGHNTNSEILHVAARDPCTKRWPGGEDILPCWRECA